MLITRVETGKWKENCYIVSDAHKNAIVIDPGEAADEILAHADGLQVKAIINTHGHYDHVSSVAELKEQFKVPFALHSDDLKLLKSANFYRLLFEGTKTIKIPEVDIDLKTQTQLEFGDLKLEILATPGHTTGGVCIKIENKLFIGDNIIGRKIGRTDLPGGNKPQLEDSIRKICALPKETEIYPGHGPMITLAEVLNSNTEVIALLQKTSATEENLEKLS